MKQIFKLGKGKLSLDEENIIITDEARKQSRVNLILSCIWIVYGIFSVIRYFKTGDQFLLWTGLFIGIAYFVVVIKMLLRTTRKEIRQSEFKSLEIKERLGKTFLDINLFGLKSRQVISLKMKMNLKNILKRI